MMWALVRSPGLPQPVVSRTPDIGEARQTPGIAVMYEDPIFFPWHGGAAVMDTVIQIAKSGEFSQATVGHGDGRW